MSARNASILVMTPLIGYFSAFMARNQLQTGDLRGSLANRLRSLQVFSSQVEADPYTIAFANYDAGRAELALRQTDAALESLRRARFRMIEARGEDNPAVQGITAHIALALALQGNVEDAERELGSEVELPQDASSLQKFYGLHFGGIVKRLAGKWAAAEELQRAASAAISAGEIDSRRRASVETELLLISVGQGDFGAAIQRLQMWPKTLSEAAPVTPDDADRLLAVGRAYLGAGQPARAIATLRAVDAFWRDFDSQSRWAKDSAY